MLIESKNFLDILNNPKNEKDVSWCCAHLHLHFFKSDEWLQSYDLKCINMYNLDGRGKCTLANLFSFPTFSNCFRPMWLKIILNCKFGQKSGLDWVKMAKFGHFAQFSIFSPKMRLRLTRNCQFHPIHNVSHLFPPKTSHFCGNPKIFISGWGHVHQQFIWVFQLFWIVSHQCGSKSPTIANLAKKVD